MTEPPFRLRDVGFAAYGPTLASSLGQGAILPVLALRARDVGASLEVAAFVVALLGLGQLVTSLPAGALVARIGERRLLIVAGLVNAAAMTVAAVLLSVAGLGLAIMVSGATWTAFLLARQGYMIDAVPLSHRARALSALGASQRVGLLVGPLVGSGIIALVGLSGVFWFSAVTSVLAAGLAYTVPDLGAKTRQEQATSGHLSVWRVATDNRQSLATHGVTSVILLSARAVRIALLPLWAAYIGMSAAETSLVFAVAGAVDFCFFPIGGWLMDRRGRAVVAVPVTLSVAVGALLLPLAHSDLTVLAVAILMGIGNGLGSGVVMTIGADAAPVLGRGQFLGWWRLCGDLGTTLGPLAVSGLTAIAPLATACLAIGGMGLAGTGWVTYWTRRLDASRREGALG